MSGLRIGSSLCWVLCCVFLLGCLGIGRLCWVICVLGHPYVRSLHWVVFVLGLVLDLFVGLSWNWTFLLGRLCVGSSLCWVFSLGHLSIGSLWWIISVLSYPYVGSLHWIFSVLDCLCNRSSLRRVDALSVLCSGWWLAKWGQVVYLSGFLF